VETAEQVITDSFRNHNYVRKVVDNKDLFVYFWMADGSSDKLNEL